jgi:hypothetical protein
VKSLRLGAPQRAARGLLLLCLLAGCRSGTPSLSTLRKAIEAGERQRAANTPETNYLRPVAFAGPPVARASSLRSSQLELLLARTGRPIPRGMAANLAAAPGAEPPAEPPSEPLTDSAPLADAAPPAEPSPAEPAAGATSDGDQDGAAAEAAVEPPDPTAAPADSRPATPDAQPAASDASPAPLSALDLGPDCDPEAAVALALALPEPFALRRVPLGSGELLCLGRSPGRRVLLRAGQGQRAALEPLLCREFARLAAALPDSPAGPLSFELALYLGPVDALAQAALAEAPASAEFVLALSAADRPDGSVPLLVRGRDPGAGAPLPPDSPLSAQAFGPAAPGRPSAVGPGDQQGAAIWLRQAWLDLFEPLGQLPSGELALDTEQVFGPSLSARAPCVGLCWGPHGELRDSISLGLDPAVAQQRALWALFAAALSLADPDRSDFDRALDSLAAERRLRREAAEAAGDPGLALGWSLSAEGARSWIRRVCFDLAVDDALPTLLQSAQSPSTDPRDG